MTPVYFEAADQVFTCEIAFAEVMATFRRKRDEGALEEFLIGDLADRFQQDWESITAVDLGPGLFRVVRHQAFRHSLKALDLLHLSALLWLRDTAGFSVVFVSSDHDLLGAARAESLAVFDPEREDPAALG